MWLTKAHYDISEAAARHPIFGGVDDGGTAIIVAFNNSTARLWKRNTDFHSLKTHVEMFRVRQKGVMAKLSWFSSSTSVAMLWNTSVTASWSAWWCRDEVHWSRCHDSVHCSHDVIMSWGIFDSKVSQSALLTCNGVCPAMVSWRHPVRCRAVRQLLRYDKLQRS